MLRIYNQPMKQAEIVEVLSKVLKTSMDVTEVNKNLKAKTSLTTKYKIHGTKLGQRGYTVAIKNVTPEGIKIFDINKVTLIRFDDIESFEKAPYKKPPRYSQPKPKKLVGPKKKASPVRFKAKIDEREEEEDAEFIATPKKVFTGHKGSVYIPAKKP